MLKCQKKYDSCVREVKKKIKSGKIKKNYEKITGFSRPRWGK